MDAYSASPRLFIAKCYFPQKKDVAAFATFRSKLAISSSIAQHPTNNLTFPVYWSIPSLAFSHWHFLAVAKMPTPGLVFFKEVWKQSIFKGKSMQVAQLTHQQRSLCHPPPLSSSLYSSNVPLRYSSRLFQIFVASLIADQSKISHCPQIYCSCFSFALSWRLSKSPWSLYPPDSQFFFGTNVNLRCIYLVFH